MQERNKKMITAVDFKRLSAILLDDAVEETAAERLQDKLTQFNIVSTQAAPPDLVTMNSKVRGLLKNGKTTPAGNVRVFTLVYPRAADISDGRISVMAPLGIELLGARRGEVIAWRTRDGAARELLVEDILYQPEASGDWHL